MTGFVANATVPSRGLDARSTPDPAAPVAARLDPGLPVAVTERRGDWARIVCANGWEAWVDGRLLLAPGAPGAAGTRSGPAVAGIGLLSLIGAVVVVVGGFLDWWNVAGLSLTAWDIPMKFLLTGDVGEGVKAGPFLLVVVVVGLPLVTHRPLPAAALLAIGLVPVLIAAAALLRGVGEDPSLDPRIGLLLTLAGGVLIMLEGLGIGPRAEGRSRSG